MVASAARRVLGGNGCVCGAPCPWGGMAASVCVLGGMAASVARRVPGNMIATSNVMKVHGDYNNPSENCFMLVKSCSMFIVFLMFNEAQAAGGVVVLAFEAN